jgi:hypothetical protein
VAVLEHRRGEDRDADDLQVLDVAGGVAAQVERPVHREGEPDRDHEPDHDPVADVREHVPALGAGHHVPRERDDHHVEGPALEAGEAPGQVLDAHVREQAEEQEPDERAPEARRQAPDDEAADEEVAHRGWLAFPT